MVYIYNLNTEVYGQYFLLFIYYKGRDNKVIYSLKVMIILLFVSLSTIHSPRSPDLQIFSRSTWPRISHTWHTWHTTPTGTAPGVLYTTPGTVQYITLQYNSSDTEVWRQCGGLPGLLCFPQRSCTCGEGRGANLAKYLFVGFSSLPGIQEDYENEPSPDTAVPVYRLRRCTTVYLSYCTV